MQVLLKREIVVNDSRSFLLTDLPFKTGEKIVVFIVTEADLMEKLEKWRSLFKETQNLPQCQEISASDIDAEIIAYRAGL